MLRIHINMILACTALLTCACMTHAAAVTSAAALVDAIENGSPGDTIQIAAGTYVLTAPLTPKANMTIKGAGAGKTIITAADQWKPGTAGLPDKDNPNAYLFTFSKTDGLTLRDMTLTAPNLHGAIYGRHSEGMHLHDLRFERFLWSAVRTYVLSHMRVHDCEFIDAGGKVKHTGGGLYMHFSKDSEFWNLRIVKTDRHPNNFFGIKGYKAERCRIHHCTIETNFAIEFAHENDAHVEIDHNALAGVVSIPKYGGGTKPDEGLTYRIHHNWFQTSYAIEFARNAVEIDHNLFDFKTSDDVGNLISEFGRVVCPGPAKFHHNLVKNPGRGLFWSNGGYNNYHFYNNHVIANTTTRHDGLFGFNESKTDFSTIVIRDNIIECSKDNPRSLMRNTGSYKATIRNNQLTNITDTDQFDNTQTDAPRGLTEPLTFTCGVNGEYEVKGWEVRHPKSIER